jgi:hypothetical protein
MIIRSPRPIDMSPKERIDFLVRLCIRERADAVDTSTRLSLCRFRRPKRSFYVAMVVGTVLNLINQGEAFFGASSINWTKIVLTYFVPYAVAT